MKFLKNYLLPLMLVLILYGLGTSIFLLGKSVSFLFFLTYLPGSIYGMFLMVLVLQTKIIKLESISKFTNFFTRHMSFFLVPGGVSLLKSIGIIGPYLSRVIIILILTLMTTVFLVGKISDLIIKRSINNE